MYRRTLFVRNLVVSRTRSYEMRLLHNFHIRDGMIAREIGYEVWLRDE
jgi:hypothetical protein